MRRVIREPQELQEEEESPAEAPYTTPRTSQTVQRRPLGDAEHVDRVPAPQRPSLSATRTTRLSTGEGNFNDVAAVAAAPRRVSGPPSFCTATSLYRSHLPTNSCHGIHNADYVEGAPASTPTHLASSSPTGGKDLTTPPRRPSRIVPSPTAYHILENTSQTPASKVYPTPPWWQRCAEGVGEAEERPEVRHGNVVGPAAPHQRSDAPLLRVTHHRNSCRDENPHMNTDRDDDYEDENDARRLSTAPPPPPPPRSRTRSVTSHRLSRTVSPSSAQSAADDDSPLRFVDPAAYGPPQHTSHLPKCTAQNGAGELQSAEARQRHQPAPSPGTSRLHRQSSQQDAEATFFFHRDASTASTSSAAMSTATSAAATSSAAPTQTQRLRIFRESAAHPSGFPVPLRGAGTAAPRTLYNGLALLPATVADRQAATRAATSGHAAVLYGTGNHPSTYDVQKYRHAVAAVTGVDPARLRAGVLSQCYMRVHSGWTEVADEGGGEAGTRLQHTTTRLRLGLRGGGAPQRAELQDPISGLQRKPNEVSAAYLTKSIQEEKRVVGRVNDKSGDNRSASTSSSVAYVDDGGDHPHHCPPPRPRAETAPGEGLNKLALERRTRANARPSLLRPTHAATGMLLTPDEKRLYWAEHAPLHHAAVRGLNALLQGVGEAESAYDAASVSTGEQNTFTGAASACGKGGRHTYVAAGRDARPFHKDRYFIPPELDPPHHSSTTAIKRVANYSDAQSLMHASSRPQQRMEERTSRPLPHADVDRARAQLLDALRQRRGRESTLMTSSILPASYRRHSRSPVRGVRDEEECADVVATTEHENDVYYGAATRRDGVESSFDVADDPVGERTMGLVDSYAVHDASGSSLMAEGTVLSEARKGRRNGVWSAPSRTGDDRHIPKREASACPAAGVPSRPIAAGDASRPSPPHHTAAFLFPPMMTPLLHEVDECLRFHGLPVVGDMWQWNVTEQMALLRSAGFSAEECQTIAWELERMIRATSTTCPVAV
ncbi:hypothetical protein ABB37_02107 [Leptomonas pyrrhocoris]|uniref:Uncharacterized protein n=1 Tax=Leptomonas pyrrhocoris TaxID=157538 RepID=A0A0M9G7I1_LEPPY|nr:hypothetical protein ABB37_02107 [Leptomonas pyrrhocoris]KPA83956.1 hypothetical protein ABB37_02107 [Leptomonas pyrrhocoris]|eukprot:XP_015662395.1 hypothetical protein ABB37_02107 [Leptomonas pyrrhocoris]